MKNVSDRICREIQNIHFIFNKFCIEIRAVYELMWKNIVQPGRPQMTIWRMHIACWIPKATNTHSAYVTVFACPLQHWLQERASLLRYAYIACLVAP